MKLAVRADGKRVGTLSLDAASGRFSFAYSADWLAEPGRFALAPSLPLNPNPAPTPDQHSAAVRQFFQNLLPEGQALEDAARINNVSKANLPGLLVALGRETAGALIISLPDVDPSAAEREPRLLSAEELSNRIRQRPELPFSVWDNKVRLSIAGYQDKLAVFERDGQMFLVEHPSLASTTILKPEPIQPQLAGMTTNELTCMHLAHAVGLPVASTSLRHVPEPVLVVDRFDREVYSARGEIEVRRLHCIDGCQALGLPVDFKYERPYGDGEHVKDMREGASLPRFFALLGDKAKVSAPAPARLAFLRWVIFQVLIGNTDAHAKNVSFFSSARGLQLAPTYDLVSTLAFDQPSIADTLAMAIGDNFDPRTISAYDWALFAHTCGLAPRLVSNELKRLSTRCLEQLEVTMNRLVPLGADVGMMERVAEVARRQATRALEVASGIVEVDSDLF